MSVAELPIQIDRERIARFCRERGTRKLIRFGLSGLVLKITVVAGCKIAGRPARKQFFVREKGIAVSRCRFARCFGGGSFPIGEGNDVRDELLNFVRGRRTPQF